MFVQEPRLTKELLSFKKSMVRFLFNGEGLDVHLVDLFFYIFLARRSFARRVPAILNNIKCVCVCRGIDEAYILFEVERMINGQIEGIIVSN